MIDSVEKLRVHLRLFKKQALRAGSDSFQLYPTFCIYFDKNKEKYILNKAQVLDMACEILIEED